MKYKKQVLLILVVLIAAVGLVGAGCLGNDNTNNTTVNNTTNNNTTTNNTTNDTADGGYSVPINDSNMSGSVNNATFPDVVVANQGRGGGRGSSTPIVTPSLADTLWRMEDFGTIDESVSAESNGALLVSKGLLHFVDEELEEAFEAYNDLYGTAIENLIEVLVLIPSEIDGDLAVIFENSIIEVLEHVDFVRFSDVEIADDTLILTPIEGVDFGKYGDSYLIVVTDDVLYVIFFTASAMIWDITIGENGALELSDDYGNASVSTGTWISDIGTWTLTAIPDEDYETNDFSVYPVEESFENINDNTVKFSSQSSKYTVALTFAEVPEEPEEEEE
ncbi:MAG: hypothetical protein LBE57_00095 [Methanosarcinales archaeon]|jgi:hypothetical protein|nr:hypothetical protein [Methanosarcinales archaeon]